MRQLSCSMHLYGIILFFLISGSAHSKSVPETEIHVTLLGQPCLLQGPIDEKTLKAIHAFGPAQLYPNITFSNLQNSKTETRSAIKKIKETQGLPSVFDSYKDRLAKRLEAQFAFLDAVGEAKLAQKSQVLQQLGKTYFQRRRNIGEYESLIRKLNSARPSAAGTLETYEQLFDIFNENIISDPEQDFHRALKRLDIQYVCSFDAEAEGEGE